MTLTTSLGPFAATDTLGPLRNGTGPRGSNRNRPQVRVTSCLFGVGLVCFPSVPPELPTVGVNTLAQDSSSMDRGRTGRQTTGPTGEGLRSRRPRPAGPPSVRGPSTSVVDLPQASVSSPLPHIPSSPLRPPHPWTSYRPPGPIRETGTWSRVPGGTDGRGRDRRGIQSHHYAATRIHRSGSESV